MTTDHATEDDAAAGIGAEGSATPGSAAPHATEPQAASPSDGSRPARVLHHRVTRHLGLLVGYLLLGLVVTWPRAAYLTNRMPNTRDQGSYAWDLWWIAHQLTHLANPFDTTAIYAPVGTPLAYNSMMPLLGVVMAPVTLTLGAPFACNLLSILTPGLAAYAMYRAARLWLPPVGSFAAGALFGMSSMLAWRAWFHLNLGFGAIFLPITLEVAVRLRRDPSLWRSMRLGLVVGLCLLVDSESAILCSIVVAVTLLPWLLTDIGRRKIGLLALAIGVGVVVASVQIIAMLRQTYALKQDPAAIAQHYLQFGVGVNQIFAPSPRVSAFGLDSVGNYYYDHGITTEGMPTFGVTVTLLALLGAVVMWRQKRARAWLVLWLVGAATALGPVIYIGTRAYAPLAIEDHGQKLSGLMPYTWFTRLPGMNGFYEANRFTVIALIPATLLAGGAVTWLAKRWAPALAVVTVLCLSELGWSGPQFGGRVPHLSLSSAVAAGAAMSTHLPAITDQIEADHSDSIVVDVPLGFRSGSLEYGAPFPAEGLVLSTIDHHPRAVGYVARLPHATVDGLSRQAFYTAMIAAQSGVVIHAARVRLARANARRIDVGWVVVWASEPPAVRRFLRAAGFHFVTRSDGVTLYRA